MSFSTDKGTPLAIVSGGRSNGEIVFIDKEDKPNSVVKHKPITEITVEDGKFELVPADADDLRVIMAGGPSGSGKSFWMARYIEKYQKLFPKAIFYLISRKPEDPVLDELDPHRVLIDDSWIEDPPQLEDIEDHSIVLFDDCDTISDKEILKAVRALQAQVLEMGRSRDIRCLVTTHLLNGNDRASSRTLLNEAQCITFFPRAGSNYATRYMLKAYMGCSTSQINKILAIDGRSISIIKPYPSVIVSDHKCVLLHGIK